MHLMKNYVSKLWSLPNKNGLIPGTKDSSSNGYIAFDNKCTDDADFSFNSFSDVFQNGFIFFRAIIK